LFLIGFINWLRGVFIFVRCFVCRLLVILFHWVALFFSEMPNCESCGTRFQFKRERICRKCHKSPKLSQCKSHACRKKTTYEFCFTCNQAFRQALQLHQNQGIRGPQPIAKSNAAKQPNDEEHKQSICTTPECGAETYGHAKCYECHSLSNGDFMCENEHCDNQTFKRLCGECFANLDVRDSLVCVNDNCNNKTNGHNMCYFCYSLLSGTKICASDECSNATFHQFCAECYIPKKDRDRYKKQQRQRAIKESRETQRCQTYGCLAHTKGHKYCYGCHSLLNKVREWSNDVKWSKTRPSRSCVWIVRIMTLKPNTESVFLFIYTWFPLFVCKQMHFSLIWLQTHTHTHTSNFLCCSVFLCRFNFICNYNVIFI